MRRYETTIIVDPELSENEREAIFEKVKDIIVGYNGFLILFDEWGPKKLAYEIRKKARGYYVRIDYCGNGTLVNELERFFRINDGFLKYMTILLNKNANIEKIKDEIAAEEKEKKLAAEAAQASLQEMEAEKEQAEASEFENSENATIQKESNEEE